MKPILTGVKVLEFGSYIAGPLAAMLLADQGAEVIKVERPTGDPYRKMPGFVVWNRGKRSITLDLKQAEGQEIAQVLAKGSDVVIHNCKPGVPEQLGIGYATLAGLNPRLIYCSVTGFGESGPYRDEPGWDPLVLSRTFTYLSQGGSLERPVYLVFPLASYYGAMMASFSTATALFVREITGRGQKVEVPLLNVMTAVEHQTLFDVEGKARLPWLPQGAMPLYRLHKASDGQWFFLALGNYSFFTKFALLMDKEEWLIDPLFEGAPMAILPPRSYEVEKVMVELIATKTRDEWLALLREADIPCAPVKRVDEYLDDPQIAANEMVVELDDPNVGPVRQMGIPIKFSLTPGTIKGPSPKLGQHTDEVLTEIGLSATAIAELRAKRIV